MIIHPFLAGIVSTVLVSFGSATMALPQKNAQPQPESVPGTVLKISGEPRFHLKREAFEGFNFVRPFDNSRKAFVAYHNDQALRVLDLESGHELLELPPDAWHKDGIEFCDVAEDGTWAVTVGSQRDGTVRIWDLGSRSLRAILPQPASGIQRLAILQDKSSFVLVSKNENNSQYPHQLTKFSSEGEQLTSIPLTSRPSTELDFNRKTGHLTFATDCRHPATSAVYQVDHDLKLTATFQVGSDAEPRLVYRVISIGEGRVLTWEFTEVRKTPSNPRTRCLILHERDMKTGKSLRQWFSLAPGDRRPFAISDDRTTLAIGMGKAFRLFDAATGTVHCSIQDLPNYHSISEVCFLSDQRRFLSTGRTDLMVWDLEEAAAEPEIVVPADAAPIDVNDLLALTKPGTQFTGILRREGIGEAELKLSGLGGSSKNILASVSFVRTHARGMPVDPGVTRFDCQVQVIDGKRAAIVITDLKAAPEDHRNLMLDSAIQNVVLQGSRGQTVRFASPDQTISLELWACP